MDKAVLKRWAQSSWEEKARENALYAVMTTPEMRDAPADEFPEHQLTDFFAKGQSLYDAHVAPLIAAAPDREQDPLIVEYGCGAGRILKAVRAAAFRCAGIDISPTMLDHCRRLVPDVEALYALDGKGRCEAASQSGSVVYSYAVVQHISRLNNYVRAFDEMCRILKPGGVIGVQVNCEDFVGGDFNAPDVTENFEGHSLHTRRGEAKPYCRHDQDNWSGVYIGHMLLKELFADRGVTVERIYYHNPKKLRAVWFVGRKRA
jgi:SAM-dependent methyltransferase